MCRKEVMKSRLGTPRKIYNSQEISQFQEGSPFSQQVTQQHEHGFTREFPSTFLGFIVSEFTENVKQVKIPL